MFSLINLFNSKIHNTPYSNQNKLITDNITENKKRITRRRIELSCRIAKLGRREVSSQRLFWVLNCGEVVIIIRSLVNSCFPLHNIESFHEASSTFALTQTILTVSNRVFRVLVLIFRIACQCDCVIVYSI